MTSSMATQAMTLVSGGSGADKLFGGIGNDTLRPGADLDADAIDGGDGVDTVDYSNATAAVTVDLRFATSAGAAANDTFSSIENIIGSDFDDTIRVVADGGTAYGGKGDDRIFGTDIANTTSILRGGEGADTIGGSSFGQDLLQLEYGKGADALVGIYRNTDADRLLIDHNEFNIGLGVTPGEIRNIGVAAPIAASIATAQFIFRATAHELYFDKDGTGGAFSPLLIATLNFTEGNADVVLASDFYII